MDLPPITGPAVLAHLVDDIGFLPFFRSAVPGLSIEEHTPERLWFSETEDGPWEWKGPVLRLCGGAYGKLFRGKAGYVSRAWFPDLANLRRDGYDFDARYDDGLASFRDKDLLDTLTRTGPVLSRELKRQAGYGGKDGRKGFDTLLTRLQMQCYIVTEDFVYARDRLGRAYGWGVAKYATPEQRFGSDFCAEAYRRTPEESLERMLSHLRARLPEAREADLRALLLGK